MLNAAGRPGHGAGSVAAAAEGGGGDGAFVTEHVADCPPPNKKRVSFGKERYVFDAGGTPRQLYLPHPQRAISTSRSNKQPSVPLKKGVPNSMAPLDSYKPQIVLTEIPPPRITATPPILAALCSQPLFPFPVPSRSLPKLAPPLRVSPIFPGVPPCPPNPPSPPGPAATVVAALRRGQAAPVALLRAEHEKEEEEGGSPCSKTKSTEGNDSNGGEGQSWLQRAAQVGRKGGEEEFVTFILS